MQTPTTGRVVSHVRQVRDGELARVGRGWE